MNATPLILAGAAAGAVAGALTMLILVEPAPEAAQEPTALERRLAELEGELDELRQQESQLAQADRGPREAVGTSADQEEAIRAAIDAWMAENGEALMASAAQPTGEGEALDPTAMSTPEEALLAIEAAESWDDLMAALQAADDAGIIDEVLAELERRAAAQPDSEDAQLQLAQGYLHKVFTTTNPIEVGGWATKLDSAYDNVLAINDQSWDARFGKAISLSNWPDFAGKQPEAIRQFEILREQQRGVDNRDGFDQTYLILGNLYQQTGRLDEARSVWQEGLGRYPGSSELQKQLDGIQ